MARAMADDYQETYRARVETRRRKYDYERHMHVQDHDAPVVVSYYGPYSRPGTALAAGRTAGGNRWGQTEVLSVTVERAEITWAALPQEGEAKP